MTSVNAGESQPAAPASLGPASLGGVSGLGIVQVLRSQSGAVMRIVGTWRPEEENGRAGVGNLKRAAETGETVRYRGKLADPLDPGRGAVELDVDVQWYRTYRYQSVAPGADGGREITLFRLGVSSLTPVAAGSEGGGGVVPERTSGNEREPAPVR